MTTDLHFICQHRENWVRLNATEFETGNWAISEDVAQDSIGGRIYLHEKQRDQAWHGGTITEWRLTDVPGRLIFRYVMDGPFRVICRDGWGQEKAIIRR